MNELDHHFQLAITACQRGAFDLAEHHFNAVLAREPNHIGALNLLGVALVQVGKYEDAARVIERAIDIGPASDTALFNHGLVLRQLKRLPEALTAFDRALVLNPGVAGTWNNRGIVLVELRHFDAALGDFAKAIELKPDFADAFYYQGNALQGLRRFEAALASYDRAIGLNPHHVGAYNNRGTARLNLGRFEEALNDYDCAIALKPDAAENHVGRGDALVHLRHLNEALAAFDKALVINPRLAQAWRGRGNVFSELERYDDAIAAFDKALELNPRLADAWLNRSLLCKRAERWQEAIAAFETFMDLRTPSECTKREHHLALAGHFFQFDCIPAIYASAAEVDEKRLEAERSIAAIHSEIDAIADDAIPQSVVDSLFASTGFYLAYQQKNDAKLMQSLSSALQRILRPDRAFCAGGRADPARIRFGIASEHLKGHNGARWALNWLRQLPADDYAFFSYAFHQETDEVTVKFAALGTLKRLPFGPTTFARTIATMQADRLDVLMLPDVGMTASSRILSQYRIAPVQLTAWGHPITTGSPNIDFFLSSALMEPEDAETHYTEKLVRLPNLALYVEPGAFRHDPHARFDLPPGRTLFGALQSLFKYLPQYDYVYPHIAKQVPGALFIFIEVEPTNTARFAARLAAAFEAEGLDPERHVRFLPRMNPHQFAALCRTIHVSIDSIGWSGGNSTIQCLEMDCPIVTLPGEFMRGRHSAAMLRILGLEDLIAGSVPEFVDKLARLGLDPAFRSATSKRIGDNKHKLFRDRRFIEALDAFLKAETSKCRGRPRDPA